MKGGDEKQIYNKKVIQGSRARLCIKGGMCMV